MHAADSHLTTSHQHSANDMTGAGSSKSPRVVLLGMGWFPDEVGGLNRYTRALLESLPASHAVVIGPAHDADERVAAVSRQSAPLPWRMLAYTLATTRLARSADVIDSHFALYAWLPTFVPSLRAKPMVVHFHGPWAAEGALAAGPSGIRDHLRWRIERRVYRRADRLITLTSAFRQILVESYGIDPWKVSVLAPGTNPAPSVRSRDEARTRAGCSSDAFVVCCVRRLTPRMGHGMLLRAWQTVAREVPGARLLIAGTGALAGELAETVSAYDLTESVELLGAIPEADLTNLYQASDLNVVPSTGLEGFGLVVLEAAATGTPSVVTRVGGLPEAVRGLATNLVVEPDSPDALAERIIDAANGDLPTRDSTARWVAGRTWANVAEAHQAVFAEAVAHRNANARRSGSPTQQLRVVYLDHVARLSGGELALLHLLAAMPEVDAHVILAEDGPLVELLNESGISVEVRPLPGRTRNLRKGTLGKTPPLRVIYDTIAYSARLAWRLRQLKPDLVHTNSLKSGAYGALAATAARTPMIWHLRDRLEPPYLPTTAISLVRALIRMADGVICNSESTREALSVRSDAFVIPSPIGIEPATRDCGHTDGASDPLVFGIIGRLTSWKGQDTFLRAFAQAFPDGTERACIVGAALFGEEDEAFARSLEHLATTLGIAHRVDFRGHRRDIQAELNHLDVLVHASTIPEPFGQVVLEGMAAGVPVIASTGGGPSEVIADGVSGLLSPPGDSNALAIAMSTLASDPGLRTRLGLAGRERAKEYTPDACARLVMSAYQVTIARAHARRAPRPWRQIVDTP